MSDVLFLAGSVLWFCVALVAVIGVGHFLIESFKSSRARRKSEAFALKKREYEITLEAFTNVLREAALRRAK